MAKCTHEEECFKRFDKIDKKLDDMNDNLFVKKDCIAAQTDRNTVFRKFSCWIYAVFTIACLGLIVRLVYAHVTGI